MLFKTYNIKNLTKHIITISVDNKSPKDKGMADLMNHLKDVENGWLLHNLYYTLYT